MSDKPQTVDFGAPQSFGVHLFRVEIPAARSEPVVVVEDYGYRGQEAGIPRDDFTVNPVGFRHGEADLGVGKQELRGT